MARERDGKNDALKRALKAIAMSILLLPLSYASLLEYTKSADKSLLISAISSWLFAVFFIWVFIAKKEKWLEEKLNDFF